VRDAYFTAVGLSCLSLFVAVQPAIRSGYQEIHRTSLLSAAANIIAMVLLFANTGHFVSIAIFMAILYGPIIFLLAADIVVLFHQRPYLLARPVNFGRTFNTLIRHSSSASAIQVAFLLFAYLPPLVVAHLRGPEATAAFGTLMQLSIIGSNAFNLIFQPLLAAMADACGHGDWPWIRRNYYRGLISLGAVGILAIPCMAAFGPHIITLWLRRDIGITNNLCIAFGFYFLLMTSTVYHFYVLSGIGKLRGVGRIYILQGILAIGTGAVLCWKFGATGMSVGLALALLALTSWYGPIKVRQALAAETTDGADFRHSEPI
jgi:O-antigen/teichoic acid export membrane protein